MDRALVCLGKDMSTSASCAATRYSIALPFAAGTTPDCGGFLQLVGPCPERLKCTLHGSLFLDPPQVGVKEARPPGVRGCCMELPEHQQGSSGRAQAWCNAMCLPNLQAEPAGLRVP